MYKTLSSISKPFNESSIVSQFPIPEFWRNNPLNPDTTIFPRQAGFRPYQEIVREKTVEPYIDNCNVYQKPCDQILPSNTCYLKNRQIVTQP